jgi:hypothetical protein
VVQKELFADDYDDNSNTTTTTVTSTTTTNNNNNNNSLSAYTAEELGFDFRLEQEVFHFFTPSRPALGPTQRPI